MFTYRSPTISVIIPVHNGGEKFRECLSSLSKCDPPPDELIVVSDGSTDGSDRAAERAGAKVVRHAEARGPAAARNSGAQVAEGEVLFFIDADVTVTQDIIARVRRIYLDEPELAAVIGSYDDAPSEANFLSQYKNLMHHYVHQTGSEEAFTFWGACGAIKRQIFFEVGGYAESYRQPSIEDIELGYRLKKTEARIKLAHNLQVKHLKRWDARSLIKTDFLRRALPWSELILHEGSFADDLNINLASRASIILVYLLMAALFASVWIPWALLSGLVFGGGLLAVNVHVYRFFWKARGGWFALKTIPWQWFYYLYSGLAFGLAVSRRLFSRKRVVENHGALQFRSDSK